MASRLTINTNSLNVPFVPGTQYRITLDAGFVKEVGNNRTGSPANNNLVTFTSNAVPIISASSPFNDDFDVENNTTVQLTFNRNILASTGNIRLYQRAVGGTDTLLRTYNMADPTFVTINNTTVTLSITGLLEADSAFYLVFDNNALKDVDNFNFAGSRTAKTITVNGNAALNNTVIKWPDVDSVLFDGVGDYLSVPSSVDFQYGTGGFEISAYIRPTTASQTSVIVDHRPTATEGLYPTLRLQSGVLQYFTNSAVRITGTTITPNTWTFVQVARFGPTTRLYVNGVQVGADYTDNNTYATAAVKIGVNGVDLSAGFAGYMSDILIKKAPIGLGGFRTRSSVNDDYTVLAIVGNFNDLNSTIFFDTQEEALGFPSLSASITGAFSPSLTVRRVRPGAIAMANNFGFSTIGQVVKFASASITITSGLITDTTDIFTAVFGLTFNNSNFRVRTNTAQPQLSFNTDYPREPFVDQTNGYTRDIITQPVGGPQAFYTINDVPNHSRIFKVARLPTGEDISPNWYVNSNRTIAVGGQPQGASPDANLGAKIVFAELTNGQWNRTQIFKRRDVGLITDPGIPDFFAQTWFFGEYVSMDDSGNYAVTSAYINLPQSIEYRIYTFSKSAGIWNYNNFISMPTVTNNSNEGILDLQMSGDGLIMVALSPQNINIYSRSGNTWTLTKQYDNQTDTFFRVSVSSNGNTLSLSNTNKMAIYTKSGSDWTKTTEFLPPNRITQPNPPAPATVQPDQVGHVAINRVGNRVVLVGTQFLYVYDLVAGPGWLEVSRLRYNDTELGDGNNNLATYNNGNVNYVYFQPGVSSIGFTSSGTIAYKNVAVSFGDSPTGLIVTFTQIP